MDGRVSIRWTRQEVDLFARADVSINVLEFFAAVYFILLWLPFLRGKTIDLQLDSSSAVAWTCKHRASAPWADDVSRLFVLTCMLFEIRVIAEHLPGRLNVIPDFRSRDTIHYPQDLDEAVFAKSTTPLAPNSRAVNCRKLLFNIVTRQQRLNSLELLQTLTSLTCDLGSA